MMDSPANRSHGQEAYVVLSALLGLFWRGKWSILMVTAMSMLMGCLYLWNTPALYEAKALIISPTEGDVAELNAGRSLAEQHALPPLTTKSIYREFIQTITSISNKQAFFAASGSSLDGMTYGQFDKRFLVREEPDFSPSKHAINVKYSLTVKAPTVELAINGVERYVDFAKKNAEAHLMSRLSAQKKNVVQNIALEIDMIRSVAEQARLDKLTQLNEALQIARSIGRSVELSDSSALYMQGENALLAEINALTARESNDPFSPGLRVLQREQASLHQPNRHPTAMNLFHLDGAVTASNGPVSPKKQLILMLTLLLGVSLGCLMVLIRALFLIKNPPEARKASPGFMRRIFR